ncbi:MAG: bifunctional oligoribonuclease/PAP phosphatase NrnA [Ignavibacteriaceae bacterium]
MIDFLKLKQIITENSSFLLTTHVNPDADAIGSEIAFYNILKKLGKEIFIVNHSITPYNLLFLDPDRKIEHYSEEKHSPLFNKVDVLVALDFSRSDRVVRMQNNFVRSDKLKICIDHHQEPEEFCDFYFLDTSYSATGQIIYDFIKKTNITVLDYETAYPIYAAIMTDTGSFRFDRITPDIHRIIAELLELKVNPNEVYDNIYDQSKFSKVKLLGKALDSMQLYGVDKQIAYMVLYQDAFKELDALESDTDGFVNFSLSVENVRIGMLFVELKDGFKISFRSKGNIPVNKLAAEYGGGGHTNAAGVRIFHEKLSGYIPIMLKKAEDYLKY